MKNIQPAKIVAFEFKRMHLIIIVVYNLLEFATQSYHFISELKLKTIDNYLLFLAKRELFNCFRDYN